MILRASISSAPRSPRSASRRAARGISNATPLTRLVSASNLWPSRNGVMGKRSRSRREREQSLSHRRLCVLLRGNLSSEGCVAKTSGIKQPKFTGPARVFNSEQVYLPRRRPLTAKAAASVLATPSPRLLDREDQDKRASESECSGISE